MSRNLSAEIAVAAARLVADEGLEYAAARRKAAHEVAGGRVRTHDLPRYNDIEAEVRAHLSLFHADTQPAELQALREVALRWMDKLAAHRPHVGGAVWRGTATRRSAVLLDLYCDDPKAAEIDLLNLGVDYDAGGDSADEQVLTLGQFSPALNEVVTLHLLVHDLDGLRGALQPDAQGQSWRGDRAGLARRMAEAETP